MLNTPMLRRTAERDRVAIWISVRDLAHAVLVRFLHRRRKSPIGDLDDNRIEIVDKDREFGVAGVSG